MHRLKIEYWRKEDKKLTRFQIYEREFEFFCNEIDKKINSLIISELENEDLTGRNTFGINFGCLWNGNKIEDILFREVCFRNNRYIPVFLNYATDDPETSSYKLFVSNCQVLIYDTEISMNYIDNVLCIFSEKYKKKIHAFSSDKLFNKNNFLINSTEISININEKNIKSNKKNSKIFNNENQVLKIFGRNSCEKNNYLTSDFSNIRPNYLIEANTSSHRNLNLKIASDSVLDKNNQVKIGSKEENKKSYINTYLNNYDVEYFIFENGGFSFNKKIRNIIFTSGSTGKPKGVKLTYNNYKTMINSFNILFMKKKESKFIFVVTNPLNHVNSTCFVEYCIRNSFELVLVHRYSREYWEILNETIKSSIKYHENKCSIIVPLVPKHFEYFLSMLESGYFEDKNELLENLSNPSVNYFFGSSAVSYDFFKSFKSLFKGKIPRIRFGSTETCLQLCGTDLLMKDSTLEIAFKKGIKNCNSTNEISQEFDGYFIGRCINPYSEVYIVKSIDTHSKDFLVPTNEYELGYIICRGEIIMEGYIDQESKLINNQCENEIENLKVVKNPKRLYICDKHPWYIGLGDQGFWLKGQIDDFDKIDLFQNNNNHKKVKNNLGLKQENLPKCACCKSEIILNDIWIYWVSRSISIIKIGGVKYSSEEINLRLKHTIINLYKDLPIPENFSTTVIGIKDEKNISQDDKIIFFYEPFQNSKVISEVLLEDLKRTNLPKSYIPFKVIETIIPKTFKGTIDYQDLKKKIINLDFQSQYYKID